MKAKTLCSTFVMLTTLTAAPLELSAKTLGMVADNETDSVTVFDADTHAILGTVPIPPGEFFNAIGDVLIAPDLKQGFVTNFDRNVFVIDLTTSPPSLAGGTNPIPISALGDDLSISLDEKFLVAANGHPKQGGPISVVDIAARSQISTSTVNGDGTSVDVCSDGSVLVTTRTLFEGQRVHRLTMSATGTLTDTGEALLLLSGDPTNVYCAPGAQSGVVTEGRVTSFAIPGLAQVDTRSSSIGNAISCAFNLTGDRLFVRGGSIDVFDFNPATGALGASPLLTFPVAFAHEFSGIDQIALHPNGTKLFVSESNALNVYNPSTGTLLASITDPNIVQPTGVTVVTEADPCALPPPAGAIVGTNGPNQLSGTSGNDKIFGLGGSDQINGKGGNDLICGGDGGDQLNGNAGNDTIVGGSGTDQITGGAGDDVLNTQDGVSGNDSANGGTGNDTCTADPGDAVSGCNP
jgi:Ca2+-binding RTX toxin-like protein